MIRLATRDDLDAVVAIGRKSLANGPYSTIIKDVPKQVHELASFLFSNKDAVILVADDNGIVGLLAFFISRHYFTGELTASEIIWYVDPESRPGGAAMQLMWEAERLATKMGAVWMQFTAPNEQVGNIYTRYGYKQIEVGYQKEL